MIDLNISTYSAKDKDVRNRPARSRVYSKSN